MNALVIEAESAPWGLAAPEAREISLAAVRVEHVVLARDVEDLDAHFLHDLIGVVELLVPRQLGDVAGVDDKIRLLR